MRKASMKTTLDLLVRPMRSPLPAPRRASGKTIRALSNAQIQKLLDADKPCPRCRSPL